MALRLSFDTTFLIDLQRERSKSQPDGPAHRFLKRSAVSRVDGLEVLGYGDGAR